MKKLLFLLTFCVLATAAFAVIRIPYARRTGSPPGAFAQSSLDPLQWTSYDESQSVVVRWTESTGAATYTVYPVEVENCTMSTYTGLTGTSMSVTVYHAVESTGHIHIAVKAVNATGETEASDSPRQADFFPGE